MKFVPFMTFVMASHGEYGKVTRPIAANLFQRYSAGDLTLIQEIAANHDAMNAASSSPTATLVQTTTVPVEESATLPVVHALGAVANAAAPIVPRKRTLEDLDPLERMEYNERELKVNRMRAEVDRMRAEVDRERVEHVNHMLSLLKTNGWFQPNDNVLLECAIRQAARSSVELAPSSAVVELTPKYLTILEAALELRIAVDNKLAGQIGKRVKAHMSIDKVTPQPQRRTQPSGLGEFEVNSWPLVWTKADGQSSPLNVGHHILKGFEDVVPDKFAKSVEHGHVARFKTKYGISLECP
jgi:hypothetical protein